MGPEHVNGDQGLGRGVGGWGLLFNLKILLAKERSYEFLPLFSHFPLLPICGHIQLEYICPRRLLLLCCSSFYFWVFLLPTQGLGCCTFVPIPVAQLVIIYIACLLDTG